MHIKTTMHLKQYCNVKYNFSSLYIDSFLIFCSVDIYLDVDLKTLSESALRITADFVPGLR